MIVCRKCSRRHADGTEFCDCGAYLPFDGEPVAEAGAVTQPMTPAAPPTPAWGAVEPASRGPAPPRREEPWSGLPGESTWGGLETTAPRAEPGGDVDARLPDAPSRDVTEPVWVEPTGRVGDVPCSRCGSPNDPARLFCRHCGQPLTAGAAGVGASAASGGRSVPWWRRLGGSAQARTGRLDADALVGDARRLVTPGGLSSRVMMVRAGGIAAVLVGLLAFLGPWRSTVISGARTALGGKQYVAVDSDVVTPTALPVDQAIPVQPIDQEVPQNVIDQFANTAWATRWLAAVPAQPGAPATTAAPSSSTQCGTAARTDSFLRFTFAEPTAVDRVSILAGRYDADKARGQYARPRVVDLQAGDQCKRFELPDKGALQPLDFRASRVEQLDVRIVDVYPGETYASTAEISELVVERRR